MITDDFEDIKEWGICDVGSAIIDYAEHPSTVLLLLKQTVVTFNAEDDSYVYHFPNETDSDSISGEFVRTLKLAEMFDNRIRLQKLEKIN